MLAGWRLRRAHGSQYSCERDGPNRTSVGVGVHEGPVTGCGLRQSSPCCVGSLDAQMIKPSVLRSLGSVSAKRWFRSIGICALDFSVAAIAFVGAYLTVFGYPGMLEIPGLIDKIGGFAVVSAVAFVVFGTYRGAWRYVSLPDLVAIMKAAAAAVVLYTVAAFLMTRGQNVPRSVPVLTLIYLVAGLIGMRLAYRIVLERLIGVPLGVRLRPSGARPVILCGLTDKAEGFIRSTRRDPEGNFEVVGIVDDSHINSGRNVQGVRVLGHLDDLRTIVDRLKGRGHDVAELVVTETTPGRRRLADILERANECSLKVSRIPDISDVASVTASSLLKPKLIEIGDLLERPEVSGDTAEIAQLIEGKVVLVTGSGGSIGSELSRQIAEFAPRRLIITDASEYLLYSLDTELRDSASELEIVTRLVDVRDRRRVAAVFGEFKPDVVFHAAALKHVPMMEENPLEALKTNIVGTRNVADAALANEAAGFIMISTDKVVNPTGIMGATKRAAEAYCQSLDVMSSRTRFMTVRFGNVLGSNGSVVPRFSQQIAAGGPVTVTHPNMMRYFMTIPEAVRLVLNACAHALDRQSERGGIMVLDMGKPVRILDLAERMIQLAGYKPGTDIEIVYSGLRPGEKLVEELFDPSEAPEGRTEDGYVLASPRFADRKLLAESFRKIEQSLESEDIERAVRLLEHVVPGFKWDLIPQASPDQSNDPEQVPTPAGEAADEPAPLPGAAPGRADALRGS
jgi:FlaA1/EpsC-like NDP-sugar epimerase